jgi:ADP-heptose:LPS heptosyltransferase
VIRRNVLIFHQAALGDFIVTWPLAMALSRVFPQSRIIYVTHSQKGSLAERVLRIESADVEAGWHTLYSDSPHLPERAGTLLEAAHIVINFTAGTHDALANGVRWIAPHVDLISIDTRAEGNGHVTDILREQLQSRPALASAMDQMLRSVADRGVGFSRKIQDRIVIHPGAGKEASRWPAERFLELIQRLRGQGKQVRVLLGEVELEKWPAGSISAFEAAAEVKRPGNLLELLDETAAASAFVGNDSGPGHLAGILGVPTLAIFSGDSSRWRPLGPRVKLIQSDSVATVTAEEIYTTLVHLPGG